MSKKIHKSSFENRPLAWMPFYIDDFYASPRVISMGLAGEAVYMRLLSQHWNQGSVSDNMEVLARSTGLSVAAFKKLWVWIEPCFERDASLPGRLVNRRVSELRRHQQDILQTASEKGKKGAQKRWSEGERIDGSGIAGALPGHSPGITQAMLGQCPAIASQRERENNTLNRVCAEDEPHAQAPGLTHEGDDPFGCLGNSLPELETLLDDETSPPVPPAPLPVRSISHPRESLPLEPEPGTKRKRQPSDIDLAGWAITDALAPLVREFLDGSETVAHWKKRNNNAARELAQAGQSPAAMVATWQYFSTKRGKAHTTLAYMQADMVSEKARLAAPLRSIDGGRGQSPKIERGWLQGRPRALIDGVPCGGWSSVAPRDFPAEKVAAWMRDGVDLGDWPEYDARYDCAVFRSEVQAA